MNIHNELKYCHNTYNIKDCLHPSQHFYIFEDGIFRNISAYIFLIALITDYLDGYIARNFNQSTAFRAFLDPVADKLLVVITIFLLAGTFNSIVFPICINYYI